MSTRDRTKQGEDRTDRAAEGNRQHSGAAEDVVRPIRMKGTPVAGQFRDKDKRIAETVADLELACAGALSLAARTGRVRVRSGAALARACSVFLRKMVLGDRDDPATRLLDDSVVHRLGIGFARLRRVSVERRTMEIRHTFEGGVHFQKLNEVTGMPEGPGSLHIAPRQTLIIAIEWPLPGATSWITAPTGDRLWTVSPAELFDMEAPRKLDCSDWLGQQLVMFDNQGITLKDVIRTVVTFQGAHSINVSRLMRTESEKPRGPFLHPEPHILDNVMVFGMKYTHIVVVECALYLYEMLVEGGHVERREDDEKRTLRLSFGPVEENGFFSPGQKWLRFAGGLMLSFGGEDRTVAHRIRAVG